MNSPDKEEQIRILKEEIEKLKAEPDEPVEIIDWKPPKYVENPIEDQKRQLQVSPNYEIENLQLLSDLAGSDADLSQQNFIRCIGIPADKFAARHSVILDSYATSKNTVLSNVIDSHNLAILQDNLDMALILAKADATGFDLTADMMIREEFIRATFDMRIRRALRGLYLSLINTQRQESVLHSSEASHPKIPLWKKLPGLGGGSGDESNGVATPR